MIRFKLFWVKIETTRLCSSSGHRMRTGLDGQYDPGGPGVFGTRCVRDRFVFLPQSLYSGRLPVGWGCSLIFLTKEVCVCLGE